MKPTKKTHDYKQRYEALSQKFWELQQIPQTKEEKEYENLINELEEMLNKFQKEIEELESENKKLQASINGIESIQLKYKELKKQEANLNRLHDEFIDFGQPFFG